MQKPPRALADKPYDLFSTCPLTCRCSVTILTLRDFRVVCLDDAPMYRLQPLGPAGPPAGTGLPSPDFARRRCPCGGTAEPPSPKGPHPPRPAKPETSSA